MGYRYPWSGKWPSFYDGPPLTDDMIARASEALGYTLPATYVDMLRERNGGWLRGAFEYIPVIATDELQYLAIGEIIGIGGDHGIDISAPLETEDKVRLGKHLLRACAWQGMGFAFSYFGHSTFIFDYGECGPSGEPKVLYVDWERPTPTILTAATSYLDLLYRLTIIPNT
jgi:hypothetical protein